MRDNLKHFPVNWIDGMKINKHHLIAQDDAWKDGLHDVISLTLSPLRFGILPPSASGEDTFNVKISLDNQDTLRVSVLACNAVTPGGVRIILPAAAISKQNNTDGIPATSFKFPLPVNDETWFVILIVHPFEKQPTGSPDLNDNPPRFPFVLPVYAVEVVTENQYPQYYNNPYALTVGKVVASEHETLVDDEYIPPCFSISAHTDLISLHAEIDKFLGMLENTSAEIVQNIFKKNQQNELSELVKFLCDRVILFLSQSITNMRFTSLHESPVTLFVTIAALARVLKNSIDMRTGSGKEATMNYFSKWTELKQGDYENMLSNLANLRYDHNDINASIKSIKPFVQVTAKLFRTLSKLEFIGELPEKDRIFIKEETNKNNGEQSSIRRRFFG
jgi:hypothetical protein